MVHVLHVLHSYCKMSTHMIFEFHSYKFMKYHLTKRVRVMCGTHTTNTIDNETLNANNERQMKFQCLCNTPTSTRRNVCPKHMFATMM